MSIGNASLFEGDRMVLSEAIELTRQSLLSYAPLYDHWAVAYSGGKDSSATLTIIAHLIETGQVPRPKSLTVLYADTRMELPPLQTSAMAMLAEMRELGWDHGQQSSARRATDDGCPEVRIGNSSGCATGNQPRS